MIDFNELTLVNYCHPDCEPLKNIMWLSREEAFRKAKEMADSHPDTMAFYRFSDFDNYYSLRDRQDKYLYDLFVDQGGKPDIEHPLSFVIEGSDYLKNWFGNGIETRIPLNRIKPEHISFTIGDSGAEFGRNGFIKLLMLEDLLEILNKEEGDYTDFIKSAGKEYVEVQVWSDIYFRYS